MAPGGELLERGESLSLLAGLLDRVRSGSEGRLVLVGGEAGVGKTALLRGFCEMQGNAVRVFWGACEPLRTPRPLGPKVLVLEDVHWADEATLDVLAVLAGRVGSAPVLVLASYRDDELDRSSS